MSALEPRYVLANRELIQDSAVAEEFDRLAAFLEGALKGLGHTDIERALEDGEDHGSRIEITESIKFPESVEITLTGAGHPQGVQAAKVGQFYRDTNTGYLFRKTGGADDSKWGWYYVPTPGPGMDGGAPVWFGRQLNDSSSSSVSGPFGIDTAVGFTGGTTARAYVAGLGWINTLTTAAVINNHVYLNSATGQVRWWEDDLDLVFTVRTASDISSVRLWAGVSTAVITDTDSIGGSNMLFRYSTAATDGGWVMYTRDGAASSVTSVIASIAASTTYRLRLRFIRSGTPTLYSSVNDGAEVSKTTNLPATGATSFWMWGCTTKAAASREFSWRSVHALVGAQA